MEKKKRVEFTLFIKSFSKKFPIFWSKKLQNLLKKKHLGSTLPALTLTILFWEILQFSKQKMTEQKFVKESEKIS
jgi:hypothetical protein